MPVSRRRQREKQERRAQILEAARTVFVRKGFLLATMDEVATEAELSKGTLYLYFKSKDDLFVAIGAEIISEVELRFQEVLQRNETGLQTVAAMMESYATFAVKNALHFRNAAVWLASGHAVDTDAPNYAHYRAGIAAVTDCFITAVARGLRDGSIRPDISPLETAHQVWGGLFGICMFRVNSEEMARRMTHRPNMETFVSGYINMICAGLSNGRSPA